MSAYIIENEIMIKVIEAYRQIMRYSGKDWSPGNLKKTGQDFFNLNTAAVNYRYDEKTVPPIYSHRFVPLNGLTEMRDAYKAIKTLIYQCSEGNFMETKTGKLLLFVKSEFADIVISRIK